MVNVDGALYSVGHGDPGRSADGEFNNCLIDSLRQCIGVTADRRLVRRDLQAEFGNAVGRAQVTDDSYLDIEHHWRSILASLFRHNTCGFAPNCDASDYCIIALYADSPGGNGNVNGALTARHRLVILNTRDIHFDPCLRL